MAFSYTGCSFTVLPAGEGTVTTWYPTNDFGGCDKSSSLSILADASRINIMAIVVVKAGTGTITVASSAPFQNIAVIPSATGVTSFGPHGIEVGGNMRFGLTVSSTTLAIVVWKKIS
jgi:hypothetical protein